MALVGGFVIGTMVARRPDAPLNALLQTTIPPEMQGRVFALLGSLFSLSTPIGLLIAGKISDQIGLRLWFQAAGFLCIAVATILSLRSSLDPH